MAEVLVLKQLLFHQLIPSQKKFWTLLQDEENRTLSPAQLCQKAGYKGRSTWYTALREECFRAYIESLGMTVYREYHELSLRGVVPLTNNPDEEWAKDIVDLRRLVTDYPKHVSAAAFKLNLSFLSNPALKALVKRYLRARLGFWGPGSLRSYLTWLKPFFRNFERLYPHLASFASVTRAMIEPILTATSWIDERGGTHSISSFGRRYMSIAVEGMFTYMQQHEWEEAPRRFLIYDEDRPPQAKKRPRPIPESVLGQLLQHTHQLHPYARNLLEILKVAGLRAVDALHLPENCLEFDATGDPRLHWYIVNSVNVRRFLR